MCKVIGESSGTINHRGKSLSYCCELLDQYGREFNFIFTESTGAKTCVHYSRYQYNYDIAVTSPGNQQTEDTFYAWAAIVTNLADPCFQTIRDDMIAEVTPRD